MPEAKDEIIDIGRLDPGFRNEIVAEPGGERFMQCFSCGTCVAGCPVAGMTERYNPRRIVRMALLGMRDAVLSSEMVWLCSTCYTCYERCPRGVEIVEIITLLRNRAVQAGFISADHARLVKGLYTNGHLVPISHKVKMQRRKLGLRDIPDTVMSDEEGLKQVQSIIDDTGLLRMVKGGE